jgi:hypothetical protein
MTEMCRGNKSSVCISEHTPFPWRGLAKATPAAEARSWFGSKPGRVARAGALVLVLLRAGTLVLILFEAGSRLESKHGLRSKQQGRGSLELPREAYSDISPNVCGLLLLTKWGTHTGALHFNELQGVQRLQWNRSAQRAFCSGGAFGICLMTRTLSSRLSRLWSGALHGAVICRHPRPPLGRARPHTNQAGPLLRSISAMETGSKMLKSNWLKRVFTEAKRPAMGFWQMLPGANISRVLARSGADWIMVDCEHGNIDGRESARSGTHPGVLHGNPSLRGVYRISEPS